MLNFEYFHFLKKYDANELFITQESKEIVQEREQNFYKSDNLLLVIVENDFTSECASLVGAKAKSQYPDISDDESIFNN